MVSNSPNNTEFTHFIDNLNSYRFEHYLTDLVYMVMSATLTIFFVAVAIIIILFVVKYYKSNLAESLKVQNALQKEMYGNQTVVQVKGNWLARKTTVKFVNNQLIITCPTKFWYQISPHVDLTREIQSRIESREFREFLSTHYSGYTFAQPIHKTNSYVLIGEAY